MGARDELLKLKSAMSASIIGQDTMVERLLLGLLADGHLLVEGLPGLAKTRAIKALAKNLDAQLSRIQFTPDLLPADITGSDVYEAGQGAFHFREGPIFANLVLADEVNRAPAKVQAALLEAMEERQVTVGGETHPLPPMFLVMATENPIEQEGTYPLPEAQLDRFLMHVRVGYPDAASEAKIIELVRSEERAAAAAADKQAPARTLMSQDVIFEARAAVHAVALGEAVTKYIVTIIQATRDPKTFDAKLAEWIQVGASPRGSIGLDKVSRAYAWFQGRGHVTPADVQAVVHDVLRHRLVLTYDALAQGVTPDQAIDTVIQKVAVS
jgi:MoxR-like ATPase